jgi:hypothetical protein
MTGSVFISYRREDSSGYARAIYNELRDKLGSQNIFMDVDAIEPGLDFVKVIEGAVGRCDILLAMIGPRWLDAEGENGPRLLASSDYVRTEIATALKRDIRVIPILVGGATMPSTEALPEDLIPLSRRNAIEIRHTHFDADVTSLIKVLMKLVNPAPEKITTNPAADTEAPTSTDGNTTAVADKRKKRWVGPLVTVLFFAVAGFVLFLFFDDLRIRSSGNVRSVPEVSALITAVGTVVIAFLITLVAERMSRQRLWLGIVLGLILFALLGFGTGIWLEEELRVYHHDMSLLSAVVVGAGGFLFFLIKTFVQRKQMKKLTAERTG